MLPEWPLLTLPIHRNLLRFRQTTKKSIPEWLLLRLKDAKAVVHSENPEGWTPPAVEVLSWLNRSVRTNSGPAAIPAVKYLRLRFFSSLDPLIAQRSIGDEIFWGLRTLGKFSLLQKFLCRGSQVSFAFVFDQTWSFSRKISLGFVHLCHLLGRVDTPSICMTNSLPDISGSKLNVAGYRALVLSTSYSLEKLFARYLDLERNTDHRDPNPVEKCLNLKILDVRKSPGLKRIAFIILGHFEYCNGKCIDGRFTNCQRSLCGCLCRSVNRFANIQEVACSKSQLRAYRGTNIERLIRRSNSYNRAVVFLRDAETARDRMAKYDVKTDFLLLHKDRLIYLDGKPSDSFWRRLMTWTPTAEDGKLVMANEKWYDPARVSHLFQQA